MMLDEYVTEELKKAMMNSPIILETDKATGINAESGNNNPPRLIGWICPVCGRGLSPFTSVCPCKGWNNWEITC